MPDALMLDDAWLALLDSRRLNAFHRYGTLHLVLGDLAWEIDKAHTEMMGALFADPTAPLTAEADRFFTRDGDALRLRDELYFSKTPSLIDPDLGISFFRRDGQRQVRVAIGRDGLAFFGRLFSMLRPWNAEDELRSVLGEGPWRMVNRLIEEGIVRRVPHAPVVATGLSVRLVCHSCVAIDTPAARTIVDPMLIVRSRPTFHPHGALDRPIQGVVITHAHWDHFTLDGLMHIERDARVVLPAHRHRDSIVNADMAPVLRELGFTDVVELDPWQSTAVADQEVTALPYHGETFGPECPRDWLCWRVRACGRELVGLVDACADDWGDMDDVVRALHARWGDIDVLFAPSSGFTYPRTHWTRRPFHVDTGRDRFTGGPEDVVRWASLCSARRVVPYALFHTLPGDVDVDSEHHDPFRTGTIADLAARLPLAPAGPLQVLRPGDLVEWGC